MCGSRRSGLFPEDKGRIVTAFLESFFAKYVGYDFTADLEEKLDKVSNSEIDWKALLRDFWNDFSGAIGDIKDLGTRQVLDSLNELLGPHIFPSRGEGVDPRLCPLCNEGQLSLKLGKYGAFIGCSRYPECKFSRVLAPSGAEASEGDRPGVRVLGRGPGDRRGDHSAQRALWRVHPAGRGREAQAIVAAEGLERRRRDARKGARSCSLCRAKWRAIRPAARRSSPASAATVPMCSTARPTPISAATTTCSRSAPIGRSISSSPRRAAPAGRASAPARGANLASIRKGGKVSVKAGRFGSYVNHGKINATIQKGTDPASLTLEDAIELLKAKAAGGGVIGRLVGEHPDGGPVTVRDGRYGAYVNWGKVNATISKGTAPDSITLSDALELIAEREGKPVARPRKPAKKAPARGKARAG